MFHDLKMHVWHIYLILLSCCTRLTLYLGHLSTFQQKDNPPLLSCNMTSCQCWITKQRKTEDEPICAVCPFLVLPFLVFLLVDIPENNIAGVRHVALHSDVCFHSCFLPLSIDQRPLCFVSLCKVIMRMYASIIP